MIGTCRINGRKITFSGGDFTIRGGASDAAIGNKSQYAEQYALKARLPYVRLLDATGGSVKTFEQIGRTYLPGNSGTNISAELLQYVPVVSAVLGSVAGLPAVQACLCHFNIMVKGTSQVFVAGPKVVEQATGTTISKEDLGDERTQIKNGVIMNLAINEQDAIDQVRRFLSYLPNNVWEAPPRTDGTDTAEDRDESLLSAVPRDRRKIYDPHVILKSVLDTDSFFEIAPKYGRARVTGLARVQGVPVGVMANNPKFNGGSMDIAAGEKTIRLIDLCETFHLPLVYFAEGGTAIAYKREIEASEDPDAKRQEIEQRLQSISSPFRNAHAFGVEDIIDPRETRSLLIDFIEDAWRMIQTQTGPVAGSSSYRP